MTQRKPPVLTNNKWDMKRIGLLAGIVSAIAIAIQPSLDFSAKVMAPWSTLDQVKSLQIEVHAMHMQLDKISAKLDVRLDYRGTNSMLAENEQAKIHR